YTMKSLIVIFVLLPIAFGFRGSTNKNLGPNQHFSGYIQSGMMCPNNYGSPVRGCVATYGPYPDEQSAYQAAASVIGGQPLYQETGEGGIGQHYTLPGGKCVLVRIDCKKNGIKTDMWTKAHFVF